MPNIELRYLTAKSVCVPGMESRLPMIAACANEIPIDQKRLFRQIPEDFEYQSVLVTIRRPNLSFVGSRLG